MPHDKLFFTSLVLSLLPTSLPRHYRLHCDFILDHGDRQHPEAISLWQGRPNLDPDLGRIPRPPESIPLSFPDHQIP